MSAPPPARLSETITPLNGPQRYGQLKPSPPPFETSPTSNSPQQVETTAFSPQPAAPGPAAASSLAQPPLPPHPVQPAPEESRDFACEGGTELNPSGGAGNRMNSVPLGPLPSAFSRADSAAAVTPIVDLWEEGESLYVAADMPGVTFKEIEIYVTRGRLLTIKAERKPAAAEPGKNLIWHQHELGSRRYDRVVELPFRVNLDFADARFENGVLLIRLTKHPSIRPQRITVRAG